MSIELDEFDRKILRLLQRDASLSQRDVADAVGLSQNACWRRIRALREAGVIAGQGIRLDPRQVGLGLTVFMMIRTRSHSREWLANFRAVVLAIPEVIDFYRIAGDYDYMLKVFTRDVAAFDDVYQRLIARVELDTVSSCITMEAIADNRPLPV